MYNERESIYSGDCAGSSKVISEDDILAAVDLEEREYLQWLDDQARYEDETRFPACGDDKNGGVL